MTSTTSLLLLFSLTVSPEPDGGLSSMADCPMHASHQVQQTEHSASVTHRGDHVMGFSHQETVHHFQLTPAGGVIVVSAISDADHATIAAIQAHLSRVARAFASGDFAMPEQIHGQVPPGVATMKERRSTIRYVFEVMPQGGRVLISSQDAVAVDAVHAFLRFQIDDHHTGDPTAVAPH